MPCKKTLWTLYHKVTELEVEILGGKDFILKKQWYCQKRALSLLWSLAATISRVLNALHLIILNAFCIMRPLAVDFVSQSSLWHSSCTNGCSCTNVHKSLIANRSLV